jgi:DNA-binding response OmpR family regulator
MRILIVEDDKKIASFIAKGLNEAGYFADHVNNGADGLQRALEKPYDAAVVDVMLPRLDGLSMIERMRARKIHTPVLILSAKRAVDDRIKGLRTGGDDYLTKPFSLPSSWRVSKPSFAERAGNLNPPCCRRAISRSTCSSAR